MINNYHIYGENIRDLDKLLICLDSTEIREIILESYEFCDKIIYLHRQCYKIAYKKYLFYYFHFEYC